MCVFVYVVFVCMCYPILGNSIRKRSKLLRFCVVTILINSITELLLQKRTGSEIRIWVKRKEVIRQSDKYNDNNPHSFVFV